MRRLVLLVSLCLAASTAWAGRRDALAKEFLAYLTAQKIDYTVVKLTDEELVLGAGTITLENLEKHIADAVQGGETEAQAREAVFKKYAQMLREMTKQAAPLSLEVDGPYLLPRLVSTDYLLNMRDVLHQPLGATGLHVTWVRDAEASVFYLTTAHLKQLGIDQKALHELARKNLAKTTPVELLRKGLTEVAAVNTGDSFDAARLILVPDALKPGEALQVAVPDRDLLILAPVPKNGDWTVSRAAAKAARKGSASGVPGLLDRPVLVTRAGYELK